MNIIIIGCGLYVSGLGTDEYGTVLPSLIERQRKGNYSDKIYVVGTRKSNSIKAQKKYRELSIKAKISLNIQFYPQLSSHDQDCYKKIIKKIKGPSCAIIVTPDHTHYKITKHCLNSGLHCLVVKPFTTKVSDAKNLENIAHKKKLLGFVEFHKRLDKSNRFARTQILKKRLGDINYITVDYSQRKEIPKYSFKDWSHKTNIFNYLGVHYVDIVFFMTGAIPKRVMAIGQKNYLKKHNINTYDSIQCLVEWESKNRNRFVLTMNVNWIDPSFSSAMSDQKVKIIGTNGRLDLNQKNRGIVITSDKKHYSHINPDFNQYFSEVPNIDKWEGYGIENIMNFIEIVDDYCSGRISFKSANQLGSNFKESITSVKVSQAVTESLKSNSIWINIK